MSAVASGTYRYWKDGAAQDIEEPWQLVRDGEAARLTGERRVGGAAVLSVTARYEGPACTALELRWSGERPRHRHYRLHDSCAQWREDGAMAWRTLVLPPDTLLYPLLRAASGPILQALLEKPRTIVLPSLRDPAAPGFLEPELSARYARRFAESEEGVHCRYFGGEYGEAGADYWLAADGLVTRYCWASANGLWEVRLADSERSSPAFAQ